MKTKTLFVTLRVLYLIVAIPLGVIFLFTPPIGWVLLFATYELYDELKAVQRIAEEEDRKYAATPRQRHPVA